MKHEFKILLSILDHFEQDLHTLDLEDYRHSLTNLTSLRIVDESSPDLTSLIQEWHIHASRLARRNSLTPPIYLQVTFI